MLLLRASQRGHREVLNPQPFAFYRYKTALKSFDLNVSVALQDK